MSRTRTLLALLVVFGLLAALGPATALADGGSAGDQQYIDPLSGVHSSGGGSHASSGSSAAPSSASATDATTANSATPTATSASSGANGDPSPSGAKAKSLPFTGFNDWQVAGLGAVLLAGGLVIRRRATH